MRIAYLGGSITAAEGWRPASAKLLQERYPLAKVEQINAGLSGTGADLGVCRLRKDALDLTPDLLFVEFAVNGAGEGERAIRTIEGIVRQARTVVPDIDICFAYTLAERDLKQVQADTNPWTVQQFERVADHYGVASIYMGLEPARMEARGELIWKGRRESVPASTILFTEDGVHPTNPAGHSLYVAAIERSLPLLEHADVALRPVALPHPIDPWNWEGARLRPIESVERIGNWRSLVPTELPAVAGEPHLKQMRVAEEPGDSIAFEFEGTSFGLFGLKGPDAGIFKVTIDEQPPLSGNLFDGTCETDRWRPWKWFCPTELAPGKHSVRIELSDKPIDKVAILAKSGKQISKPEQLAGHRLYLGYVAVIESKQIASDR